MKRTINFSPGPATLPLPVLQEMADELFDFSGTGKSIFETSHRSPEYDAVHTRTQELFKKLLGLGDEHHVAFFGGGASTQFAMVPMNLLRKGETADYLLTGAWAKKAHKEAQLFGEIHVAADTAKDGKFTRVPKTEDCSFSDGAVYAHVTSNNTIFGTQYHGFPQTKAPLVADMSSDLLWGPIDTKPFGLIYAGAQKNLGPAGVTVVIIRQDLLDRCSDEQPSMMRYKLQLEKRSLYNTPPCSAIYMVCKTLEWVEREGGLEGMEKRNRAKADLLYGTIDSHPDFFRAPVEKESRSLMNVVFRLPSEELEQQFIAEGKEQNMIHLKGHRSVGGIRVSIYNAAEQAWLESLTQFMEEFYRTHG